MLVLTDYCSLFLFHIQMSEYKIISSSQVRAALLKSLSVYMSIRGHHDWVRRPSMFSAAYNNTAADTEAANYAEVLDRYKHDTSTTKQSQANEMVPLR